MAKTKPAEEKATNAFLPLEDVACRLGKFSNNLVKSAGPDDDEEDDDDESEEVGVFTFPVTELLLTKEQVIQLFGDKHVHACWYNTSKGVDSPMPWIGCLPTMGKDLPPGFAFNRKFENVVVELAYAESPNGNTVRDKFEGCKIARIRCMPRPGTGGNTEVKLHLQIRPGIGKANLRLQEAQNHRIAFTVLSADVAAAKDSKQQQLALGSPPAKDGEEPAVGAGFAAAAQAKVAGYNRGRPVEDEEGEGAPNGTH
jgi:hypothetical protein